MLVHVAWCNLLFDYDVCEQKWETKLEWEGSI